MLLFTWVTPIVNFAKRHGKLEVEYYGDLNDSDRVETALKRLEDAWDARRNSYKERNEPMPGTALFYTVFNTFKWDYLRICALTSLTSLMNLSGPFLINPLVTYIKDGEIPQRVKDMGFTFFDNSTWPDWLAFLTPDMQYGLALALTLVTSQSVAYLV